MGHTSPSATKPPSTVSDLDEYGMCGDAAPVAEIAAGGAFFRVRAPKRLGYVAQPPKRGKIKAFTRSSRKRLIDKLASIDRRVVRKMPLFMTLTYPGEYSADSRVWKRDLDAFLKAVRRVYPAASGIWKLEYQKRGAPHYHILMFGIPFIPKSWVAETWYRVVGSGDARHIFAGTRIERVKSWNGVMFYAAKYMSKETDVVVTELPGRFWGVFNRAGLPINVYTVVLGAGQFYRVRRVMFHVQQKRGKKPKFRHKSQGSSIYIAEEWAIAVINNAR